MEVFGAYTSRTVSALPVSPHVSNETNRPSDSVNLYQSLSVPDDRFEPKRPEFLQYNGNDDDDVLVGMAYYVRTNTGLPPAGFAGNNDWWHHHLTLCLDPATAQARGVNTSESQCTSQGGVNVYLDDYYMLHVWLVDDLEYERDVHAPFHPCIKSTGAIFDMDDPCHDEWQGSGATALTGAHANH